MGKRFRGRKSEKTVCGMPLWYIGRNAKGFIAVELNARGAIAVRLKAKDITAVKQSLNMIVPTYLSWEKEIIAEKVYVTRQTISNWETGKG